MKGDLGGGKKVLIAAVALALTACSPLMARPPARPSCADAVASAFTSTTPVHGAYSCMAGNEGRLLAQLGIISDDSWAEHNRAAGQREPFVFETRLHDGAFVYHEDIHVSNGQMVTQDLVLWLAKDGEVYGFDLISLLDG